MLANGGVFQDREIPGGQARSTVGVAADVAVKTAVRWRRNEGGGIKPLIRITKDNEAGKIGIEEGAHRIARVAVIGGVVTELRRKGKARLNGHHARQRP